MLDFSIYFHHLCFQIRVASMCWNLLHYPNLVRRFFKIKHISPQISRYLFLGLVWKYVTILKDISQCSPHYEKLIFSSPFRTDTVSKNGKGGMPNWWLSSEVTVSILIIDWEGIGDCAITVHRKNKSMNLNNSGNQVSGSKGWNWFN